MLNFTIGPVESDEEILSLGAKQLPYFRTPEFSNIMLENERLICKFAKAPQDSRAVFITGSGTASMEATIINCFNQQDKVLIVNGGSFGARFVALCQLHKIPYTEIKLQYGEVLTEEKLSVYDRKNYTGFIINIHESSTGVYYNPELISNFCRKNNLFLVVDAISSFIADIFLMEKWKVNVMITSSQKALAIPPGISIIILDKRAQERVKKNQSSCMYFDLNMALKDGERGQTPFTPAVGILLQINLRLKKIDKIGLEVEQQKIKNQAEDFRKKVKLLPVSFFSKSMSNALTALCINNGKDAYKVFCILKDKYHIWICPNGGDIAHKVLRVGHIGDLTKEDNDELIKAMKELEKKGIL